MRGRQWRPTRPAARLHSAAADSLSNPRRPREQRFAYLGPTLKRLAFDPGSPDTQAMSAPPRVAFRYANPWFVMVHGAEVPLDDEWRGVVAAHEATRGMHGSLIVTYGGGPSATQRKEHKAFWDTMPARVRVAIISSSVAVRGMVTAMNWMTGGTRHVIFEPLALKDAVEYIGATSPGDLALIDDTLNQLHYELGLGTPSLVIRRTGSKDVA